MGNITRKLVLIAILSIMALSAAGAESLEWQFQYVSNLIDNVPSPVIWFTEDEEGLLPWIDEDELPEDGSGHVFHLHVESWGATGMSLSLTPLSSESGTVIPFTFSYDGETSSGTFEVRDEDAGARFSGWTDPLYVRTRRDWRLMLTPDGDALNRAAGGSYRTTLTVEVSSV